MLWRDNYGWCPFCGPTQLLLEEKQIPYVTCKVPLNNYKAKEKPRAFLDRVANGLVPDVTLHMGTPAEETLIPRDGYDLLPVLEARFAHHGPRLAPPDACAHEAPAFHRACGAVQRAVSAYASADERGLPAARDQLVRLPL